jgi:hypothetical protein
MLTGNKHICTGYPTLKKLGLLSTQTSRTLVHGSENSQVSVPVLIFSSVKDLEIILVSNYESRPPSTPFPAPSPSTWAWLEEPEVEDLTPADLADEEIEAYAEECAQRAALAEFEDIPEEELFNWSPDEFDVPQPTLHDHMDMS